MYRNLQIPLSRPETEFINPHDFLKLIHYHQQRPEKRLRMLHEAQKRTFQAVFLAHPTTFYTTRFHYDWFMFPLHAHREWNWAQRNYDCLVTVEDGQQLVQM